MKTLRGFPEYNRDPENPDFDSSGNRLDYVLGGFGALGNPASFHNPLARDLRLQGYIALMEQIFRGMIEQRLSKEQRENMKIEMLFDRMMYRITSQKPSAESWHRDVMPPHYIQREDEVFGGWLNLDTQNQYMSCIPGSNLGVIQRELAPGFASIDKEKVKMVSQYKHRFTIPPGHLIIFPQYHISFFLRRPFRTIPNRPHRVNLIEWSRDTMLPRTLVQKCGKGGEYEIVRRHMLSLQEYGFPMYLPYTEEEKAYYRPHRV